MIIGLILGVAVAASTGPGGGRPVGVLIGAASAASSNWCAAALSADHSAGMSRSISASQILADMSDGARQSPRGDGEPPRTCRLQDR